MSVASEIARLQQAKADLKTAIEGKGVTVPSNALLDDYADLVDAIQQGSAPVLQSKSVNPTTSQQTVTPDSGYDGLSSVSVGAIQTETKNITPTTSQQTVDPSTGKFISQVVVSAIQTETKTATPSASQQNITPSSGKFLTQVTVDAVPTETKTATPSTSQQDITPTSGKFLSKVTVSAIQTETKTATPSTSQQDITPSSGKFLSKVTVSAVQTETKSATPSTTQQDITPSSGKYLTKVTVGAIQTETKSVTPSTSAQNVTPSSGKFLTQVSVGAVTHDIDANIVAGNIKKNVTILGVTGTYEGSGGGGSTLVPTAGDYPVVGNGGLGGGGNALTSTGISVTIPVSGTYRFKWCAFRRNNSGSYTWASRLYRTRGGTTTAIGTQNSSWTSTYIQTNSQDIAVEAGDVITVYVAGRSSSYSWGGMLTACVAQKLWTN